MSLAIRARIHRTSGNLNSILLRPTLPQWRMCRRITTRLGVDLLPSIARPRQTNRGESGAAERRLNCAEQLEPIGGDPNATVDGMPFLTPQSCADHAVLSIVTR